MGLGPCYPTLGTSKLSILHFRSGERKSQGAGWYPESCAPIGGVPNTAQEGLEKPYICKEALQKAPPKFRVATPSAQPGTLRPESAYLVPLVEGWGVECELCVSG